MLRFVENDVIIQAAIRRCTQPPFPELRVRRPCSPLSQPSTLFNILRQKPFPVLVDDIVNHLFGNPGKIRSFDDGVDFVLPGDDLGRRGRGEVGPEDQFVLDPVFDRRQERLIMTQRPVMQSGDVRVEIRVLANQHDAFVLPRVPHVSDDDP